MGTTLWWAASFVATGFIGRLTIVDGTSLSLVWPAAGVAALWLAHARVRRTLPQDAIALTASAGVVNLATGASPFLALDLAVSNLAQAWVFLAIAVRVLPDLWGFGGTRPLARIEDLARLTVAAAFACLVGAAIGSLGFAANGGDLDPLTFATWWGRNAAGMVVVGSVGMLALPLLLGGGTTPRRRLLRDAVTPRSRAAAAEVAALLAVTGVVYLAVYGSADHAPLALAILLPTVWCASRFSPLGVALHALTCGVLAVTFTLVGNGLLSHPGDPTAEALAAQLTVMVTTVVGLALAFSRAQQHETADELRTLLGASTMAALISTDLEGRIRTFGVGAERLLGYRAEEALGLHHLELFHDPAEIDGVASELGVATPELFAALAHREESSRIWTMRRRDGDRLFARLALSEHRSRTGRLLGHLAVAIDATAAIESRRALVDSQARWKSLLASLPETTVLTVDDALTLGTIAGAGSLAAHLAGSEGSYVGTALSDANASVLRELVDRALVGDPAVGDFSSSPGQPQHQFLATVLPGDGDGHGEEREVLLVGRDVSRERRRELELTLAKDRAEMLFSAAPHGIAVLEVTGVIRRLNPALSEILGCESDGVLGRALQDFSLDRHDTTVASHLEKVLSKGATTGESWALRTTHGVARTVSLSGALLPDVDGPGHHALLVNLVDITETERYQRQLSHLADHDPLTGLQNRRRFHEELERHLDADRSPQAPGAVLMFDLDHFKQVNDTGGHLAGDTLLKQFADLLRTALPAEAVIARFGGDEFVALVPGADTAQTRELADRVVRASRTLLTAIEPGHHVTVSVGGALAATPSVSEALAVADTMLYEAKQSGRDRYRVHAEGCEAAS